MNVIPLRRTKNAPEPSKPTKERRRVGSVLLHALWLMVAIAWPLLRWLLALDVTFQFLRMLIGFVQHGPYLDWTFLLHFIVYVFLICFVTSSWKR